MFDTRFKPTSVDKLDARPICDQEIVGSTPAGPVTFERFDHEIFSTVILFLLLIQEGQLSVSAHNTS